MPCFYTGSAEGDARLLVEEANSKLTMVTQLLCAVLETMEKRGQVIPQGALEWWKEHKKIDAKRRADEEADKDRKRQREIALTKLTKQERRALGIWS